MPLHARSRSSLLVSSVGLGTSAFAGHFEVLSACFLCWFEDECLRMPLQGHVCLLHQLIWERAPSHARSRSCLHVSSVGLRTSAIASPFEVKSACFLSWIEDECLCKPFRGQVNLFPQLVSGRAPLPARSRLCLLVSNVGLWTSAFACPF